MSTTRFWTKPRIVFAVWGGAELIGWLATHFWPDPRVNWIWLGLSILAMVPMVKYMPWKSPKLRKILILWLLVVALGMILSFLAFLWGPLAFLGPYLGAAWLILMGVAFLVNATWWDKRGMLIGGFAQILAGVLSWILPALSTWQYLIAAVVGTGAMVLLMFPKKGR